MKIDRFWLPRPQACWEQESDATLEEFCRHLPTHDGGWLEEPPVAKWELLAWLTEHGGLLAHGSAKPDIALFEPCTPTDRSPDDFSKQTAVFAASDGI